jgi:isoquinoline 1-oxidoreductase beta subunit
MFVHRLRGAIREGKIVAWANTLVGQSFIQGKAFAPMVIKDGIDPITVEGSREVPYEIPNFRCDVHTPSVGVPTLWWRSVGYTHTGYAVECFIDELLQATGQDPVGGRLAMMGKAARAAGVSARRRAACALGWAWAIRRSRARRGRGRKLHSYVAQIAEVSAGDGDGPKVHKVWCAVDCGVAVNPDVIRAQMEGGIGFGLGMRCLRKSD